jgi:hypothetical protein
MLRSDTYFEQVPLETIKPLIRKSLAADVITEPTPPIEEKDSENPLKAEA